MTEGKDKEKKKREDLFLRFLDSHPYIKAAILLALLILLFWLHPTKLVVYGLWGWGAAIAVPILGLGSIFAFASLASIKEKAVRKVRAITYRIFCIALPVCQLASFFLVRSTFRNGCRLGLFVSLFGTAMLVLLLMPLMNRWEKRVEKVEYNKHT